MKYILLTLLLLPCAGFAQKAAPQHDKIMAWFVKYYNSQQGDSIRQLFPAAERNDSWAKTTWGAQHLQTMHNDYGRIVSFKYLGIDKEDPNPGLIVYQTKFSKVGWKTTSFTTEDSVHVGTFRFITSSDGIDKLLKELK